MGRSGKVAGSIGEVRRYTFRRGSPRSEVRTGDRAFLSLLDAVRRTALKPRDAEDGAEWEVYLSLMGKLDALSEPVKTQDGSRVIGVKLAGAGGVLELTKAEDDLLWAIWRSYVGTLPFTRAGDVVAVKKVREAVEIVKESGEGKS